MGVPDQRLGELVAVVVSPKEEYKGQVQEYQIIEIARQRYVPRTFLPDLFSLPRDITRLPKFAVPVMVVVQDAAFGTVTF